MVVPPTDMLKCPQSVVIQYSNKYNNKGVKKV